MRFGLALVLLLAACGDPIEVGNASKQGALANDRKLADLTAQLHGKWQGDVSLSEVPPLSIAVEMTFVEGDEDNNERSGAFTMKCVSPICERVFPFPAADGGSEDRRLSDVVDAAGTYQLIELDDQGMAAGILRDGSPNPTEFYVPKGAGALVLGLSVGAAPELRFTRVP